MLSNQPDSALDTGFLTTVFSQEKTVIKMEEGHEKMSLQVFILRSADFSQDRGLYNCNTFSPSKSASELSTLALSWLKKMRTF